MWWKNKRRQARKAGRIRQTRYRLRCGRAGYAAALILALASLCMSGCGVDDIDISGYADETITLAGVADEDIRLTVADLKEMDCVTVKTESTSDKIGQVRATGPTLDEVLSQFGMSQQDIGKIRVYGKDKYDVKLDRRVLAESDVILAVGIDGQPLGEEDAPVRIIIPESDSAYWVRMVERIELED
ncbi:MAG: molybdopterin-dependent oxidoreductase [Firmicutes bacterium]|nr:molybdopterin-dependent oxidoreductase [Bacillota bacterium]